MNSRAIDELAALLQGSDTGAAIAAATELGQLGTDEAAAVLEAVLLGQARSAVRVACADALGSIPSLDAATGLVRALNETDPLIWHAAAEALAGLDEEAMPAVIALLQSREADFRRAALRGLLWLTVEHHEAEVSVSDFDFLNGWGWWN